MDGNLNAQRYRDEILKPIVVPFICHHYLMFQHDNAQPQVTKICTQFLEAENVPVLSLPSYSPGMSSIEHVWDALDRRVPVPANIQQLRTAIEEEWDNIPEKAYISLRHQSTLEIQGELLYCITLNKKHCTVEKLHSL